MTRGNAHGSNRAEFLILGSRRMAVNDLSSLVRHLEAFQQLRVALQQPQPRDHFA